MQLAVSMVGISLGISRIGISCFSCDTVIIGDVFDVLSNFLCCLFMTSDMIIAISSVDVTSCLIVV